MRMRMRVDLAAVVCAFLVLTSCGGDDDDGTPSGKGGMGGGTGATGGSSGTGATGGQGGTPDGGGSGGTAGSAGADGGPCVDSVNLPLLTTAPATLSATGLYSDISQKTLATYVKGFEPRFKLWSDAAEKVRYVYIPECAQIDTSDMDHWKLPVGARFWKEFTRDGVLVETRFIHRFGPGDEDWLFAAYQWSAVGSAGGDATLLTTGVSNANGTEHDIPSPAQCKQCHSTLPEKILGFSAFQLSHSFPGETMASLSAAGRLTVPNANGFDPPGATDLEKDALGYLHANCGNCHHSSGLFPDMKLRLLVDQTTVQTTDTYTTSVGVPVLSFDCGGNPPCDRIEPGNPTASAVIMRMSVRQVGVQMPPIGTEVVDDVGVKLVSDWIAGL